MNLKSACVWVVLVSGTLFPSIVLAEGRPYFSLLGGYTTLEDTDAGLLENVEFDDGFVAGAAVGYDMGYEKEFGWGSNARVELEFTYRQNDLDKAKFLGAKFDADGEVTSQALMANAYYLVENPSFIKPFFMAGIGAARIDINEAEIAGVNFIDQDEVNFAYQAGGGLAFVLSDALELNLGYRYFRVINTDFEDAVDNEFSFTYETHNIYLGLLYAF